jgi:hypothetical protein
MILAVNPLIFIVAALRLKAIQSNFTRHGVKILLASIALISNVIVGRTFVRQ